MKPQIKKARKGGMCLTKKKKILLAIAVLAIILLAFIGGQAYAKYITEVKGEGIAEVATWSFKVNGQKEQVQEINLVSTCNDETLVNNKIAPGTSGSFNIVIDGTSSDVGINYNISFKDEENKPDNLKFIYENVEYNSIQDLENNLSGTINANETDKTRTLNIGWEWKYETGSDETQILQNDLVDTKNAEEIQNYTFSVSVTGTQVEPTK